jgi:TM2 domain-containing membrane protein YozV
MSWTLLGLCHLARGSWAGAYNAFQEAPRTNTGASAAARLKLLTAAAEMGKDLPGRSPGLATAFSLLVPGTGQMYAGRSQDGLRHLIFNGALIYTVVKLLQDEHYPAAYLVATFGLPFYLGNVLGAHRSAAAFNRDQHLAFTASTIAQAGVR